MELVGWSSLYIPYLDNTYTSDELTYMFEVKYAIGKIKRIDIVHSFKKQVKTAFVHFETWYWNDFTVFLRKQLESRGKYNMNAYTEYLRDKINNYYNCEKCRELYQNKLLDVLDEVDDIPFLIHRTKYTHTHLSTSSTKSVSEESEETTSSIPLNKSVPMPSAKSIPSTKTVPSAKLLSPTSNKQCAKDTALLYRMIETVEQQQKRIEYLEAEIEGSLQLQKRVELLEDEMDVLAKHYTASTNPGEK